MTSFFTIDIPKSKSTGHALCQLLFAYSKEINTSARFVKRRDMKHFEQFSSFYNRIIRLNADEQEKPVVVFDHFFFCYNLEKCRKTIRIMQESALLTPNTIYDNGEERFNMICFCRGILPVFDAAWLLYQESLPKKRRSPKDETSYLTKEQKDKPIEVIQSFLTRWELWEIRKALWDMLECALIADDDIINNAYERQHLIWFYQYLEKVLEAGWVMGNE